MNDREYLRSLGFTVGDRGRFSSEMKAALASRDGVDPDSTEPQYKAGDRFPDGRYAIEPKNNLPSLVKQSVAQRDERIFIVTTTTGQRIACGNCGACRERVMYCECDGGPKPPRYLEASDIASFVGV